MQINFDLDEFLAYLLNGMLMLLAIYMLFPDYVSIFPPSNDTKGFHAAVVGLSIGAMAMILGHASSVFARLLVRNMAWKVIGGRPREAPFVCYPEKFWHPELTEKVWKKYSKLMNISKPKNKDELKKLRYESRKTAPRIIRSYALEHSEQLCRVRNRIVRARSLCGNAVLPLLMMIIAGIRNENPGFSAMLLLVLLALIVKQTSLDKREWKEIYTSYIAK